MGILDRLMAATYDRVLAPSERAGLRDHRVAVLAGLSGEVLEIGGGTGLNLAHYPDAVTRLVVAEPTPEMRAKLEAKLPWPGQEVEVVDAHGEALGLPDASFDHVVSTLVLCTVADPLRTLAEARRVLRPGGTLRVIEHVASSDPAVARWQLRLQKPWGALAGGCQLHRDTRATLVEAGFDLTDVKDSRMPGISITRAIVVGVARR